MNNFNTTELVGAVETQLQASENLNRINLAGPTQDIEPLLCQCWPFVYDVRPTLTQQWLNASCFLGRICCVVCKQKILHCDY